MVPSWELNIQHLGPSMGPERQYELLKVTQQISSSGKPPRSPHSTSGSPRQLQHEGEV